MELFAITITILLALAVLLSSFFRSKSGLPSHLINIHRFHDYIAEILEKSGMTVEIKGPWFTNMHHLITADPANIHHVTNKRVDNFVKGYKLHEIMDVLGDGILTTDSPIWEYHRNAALSFFNNPNFQPSLIQITLNKIESGLIPLLDHASKHDIEVDLQDVFLRFMYDTSSNIMMNHDPNSLSIDLPYNPLIKAVTDGQRVIFLRHLLPTCIWKFMRWLNVGQERKYKQAWKTLDSVIYSQIYMKREERKEEKGQETQVRVDLLTLFMDKEENQKNPLLLPLNNTNNYKFLRDTIANFFLAGAETTSTALSWFFYLLSKHPQLVHKIKDELRNNNVNNESFLRNFTEVSGKLIYLHATLCETLRLYPSIPFDPKASIEGMSMGRGGADIAIPIPIPA